MGYDVDNAKDLREAIVSTYVNSEWPITDLLWGAWYVDEASRVAKALKRSRRGIDALTVAYHELKHVVGVPSRLVAIVEDELSKRK